jgi:branched-chain amino acid transport system substrate-binding protein
MRKNLGVATAIVVVAIVIALVVGIAGGYLIAPRSTSTTTNSTTPTLKGIVNIGVAIPLSGGLGTYGDNAQAALQLAESQINTMLASSHAGWSINLTIMDTQTDPKIALEDTQTLASEGCQVIIGYYSSGELSNCMSYAQQNGIVLISPSSTAISLSIDKPYIYRFVPADDKQGPAMATGMWAQNITYIVPIYMLNTYGEGLAASTENSFVALGGQYDHTNISYDPLTTTEFSTQAALLNTEVTKAISQYGASHVAVYAVTYEEVAGIMDAASQYPALSQVKWYGCDGSALSSKVTADPVAAKFAIETEFPATYFAPTNSSIQTAVMQYVQAKTGNVPDPYAYGSYDALWVVADCIGLTQQYNGAAINSVLPTVANMTFGASGWCSLNSFGDRTTGDYQFWQVYQSNATAYSWYLAGYYSAATKTVTWYPAPT